VGGTSSLGTLAEPAGRCGQAAPAGAPGRPAPAGSGL